MHEKVKELRIQWHQMMHILYRILSAAADPYVSNSSPHLNVSQ